jgi:hypothetical protein
MKKKKQYGFFCYSWEEWGISEWKGEEDPRYMDEGPYNSFTEAKEALYRVLANRALDYRWAANSLKSKRKSDFI